MNHTVYIKPCQITELTHKDVCLKDVAQVYCSERSVQSKCQALKIRTIRLNKRKRYVMSVLEVIRMLTELDSSIQVTNLGEADFIIAYQPPSPPALLRQWLKTLAVCGICFFGAAFAIMTFNNDVNVADVFQEIYKLVMGRESGGFTVLELGYSIGLALGITLFFNHVAAIRLNTDPTPLEVEMRLYEENICKTLIDNAQRKESGIDTD